MNAQQIIKVNNLFKALNTFKVDYILYKLNLPDSMLMVFLQQNINIFPQFIFHIRIVYQFGLLNKLSLAFFV